MKLDLKKEAVSLRRQGYIYAEIAKKLKVSRSTARIWTASLDLNESEQELLNQRKLVQQRAKMTNLMAHKRERRLKREQVLLSKAQAIVRNITPNKDEMKLMCAVFYWCEGTKDVSSGLKFTNADPFIIQKFLFLLRNAFDIDERKFRALVHLHEYHDERKQLEYWSKLTNLPVSQFHKSYIKPNTSKNRHAAYPGCISVRYLDAALGKLLKMIYSEYGKTS